MGLYQLNSELQLIKSYTRREGLPNNLIVGIQEDDQGNIWVTTKGGLSYENLENGFIQNFNIHDGIQGLEFQSKSIDKTKDGRIIAGGINGFNLFDPKSISVNTSFSSPQITDLAFYNKKIRVGDTINGRVILDKPIGDIEELNLKYDENYLSFEYVALN